MNLYIASMRDRIPSDAIAVNTTSSSTSRWSKGLSPFFCGPCELYGGYTSKNVENLWQFSKLYAKYTDSNGNPTSEYFEWAQKGWNDTFAHRYPMGKGAKPLCAYWDGIKLNYIEARKQIYIPFYAEAVVKTEAYQKLKKLYYECELTDIYLQDFDGYDHKLLKMTYEDVINEPNRKMGHAFVLGMLLEGYLKV